MKKVQWLEMFPDELLAAIREEGICYLPFGLAEPHGAYNALGLDFIKANGLMEMAAHEHGGVVAPPFAWHIQERPDFHDDGKGNGWLCDVGVLQNLCSSIPCKLFFNIVMHQVRAFDARGFKAAILVTGHYGGIEIFLRLLCEYYVMASGSPIQLYACADWELNPEYGGDHAGKIETSQLMTISPEHVDLERRQVDAELGGKYAGLMSFEPDEIASREFGEAMVSGQVAEMGRKKDELLANYKEQEDWRAPDQNRTEEIWQSFWAKVGPYADCSYEDYKNGKMNEFPGWDKV